MAVLGKSGGAYATVNRSPNYMGEALSQNADLKYKYDVLNQDRKNKEAQVQNEKDLADANDFKDLKYNYSGVTSLDDVGTVFLFDKKKELAEAMDSKNRGELSLMDYALKKSRIMDNVNRASTYNDLVKAESTNFQTLVNEGKVDPDFVESKKGYFNEILTGKYVPYTDPQTNEFFLVKRGKNDKGEDVILDKKSYEESATNMQKYVYKEDFVSKIKEFQLANKPDSTENISNNIETGRTEPTKRLVEAIDLEVEKLINNPNTLSVAYKDATGKAEMDIKDAEKIKVAQEYLKDKYLKSYNVEVTKAEATQIANFNAGRDDEAYKRKKDAEAKAKADAEEKDKKPNIQQPSVVIKAGLKDKVKLQKGARDFPITNAVIKNAGGTESKATNVYVNPGGKMYLRIEKHGVGSQTEKNDDGTTSTTSKIMEVQMLDFGTDGDQIGRYAQKLDYSGANDFKEDMIARSGGDKFITTPNERKPKSTRKSKAKTATKKTTPAKTIQFDAEGNIID